MNSQRAALVAGLAGVAVPFVLLWFRHRALAVRPDARPLSIADRRRVAKQDTFSRISFVGVIVIGLSLVVVAARGAEGTRRGSIVAALVLVSAGIAWHLNIRCPSCKYRLGLQQPLGTPRRCERCGADLTVS